jgi:hypothetical protein
MNRRYVHVTLSYEQEGELLSISTTDSTRAAKDDDDRYFEIARIPVCDLFSAGSEKAEAALGAIIITTLNRLSDSDSGLLEANEEHIENGILHLRKLMTEKANLDDVRAQEFLAVDCLARSLSTKDLTLLDAAETWYRKAAENGSKSATAVIERQWQDIYRTYRERIEKSGQ